MPRMPDPDDERPEAGGARPEIGRAISLLVALACLIMAYLFWSREVFHLVVTVVVLPLGGIWYGREIGSFAGTSPSGEDGAENVVGAFITIAGWIILFSMLAIIGFAG